MNVFDDAIDKIYSISKVLDFMQVKDREIPGQYSRVYQSYDFGSAGISDGEVSFETAEKYITNIKQGDKVTIKDNKFTVKEITLSGDGFAKLYFERRI